MMRHGFSDYHPIVNMLYFVLVIISSMMIMHPICLSISMICSLVYSGMLLGSKSIKNNLRLVLPMALMAVLINAAFNHEGTTILLYLKSGNPLTLESMAYGVGASTMLISVICWFSCYNEVMTSDKFIYLFGRIIPSLSLLLSMVLRFVPKFKEQIKVIAHAQKCIGQDIHQGNWIKRAQNGLKILSILVTWALENSIQTADSMRSRGYGFKGRTAFSIFRITNRDVVALMVIVVLSVYLMVGMLSGGLFWRYFPNIRSNTFSIVNVSLYIIYAGYCSMPIIIEIMEDNKWKRLESNL